MSDLICRKTMMRCQTPGMCSPHGGCQQSVLIDTNVRYATVSAAILGAENLNKALDTADLLRAELDQERNEAKRLKGLLHMIVTQAMPLEDIPDLPGYSRVVDANRLVSENESLRKDAERYRWLRDECVDGRKNEHLDCWVDQSMAQEQQL